MTLSDKIRTLRKEKGLKVAQLAQALRVSEDAVSRWEHGMRVPELDNLIKLSDAFGVSLDVFRQDAARLDLPNPFLPERNCAQDGGIFANGVPLKFGSAAPNKRQKAVLDFCADYLETLDGHFFVKGAGQNSEYGTGRYFWESKIDLLMFIGIAPPLEKTNPGFALSVSVNTEAPLFKDALAEFNCLQVADGADENWIYVPINQAIEKSGGRYAKALRDAADYALVTAMKIARRSLESSLQRFVALKAAPNHTKDFYFEQS